MWFLDRVSSIVLCVLEPPPQREEALAHTILILLFIRTGGNEDILN